MDSKDLPVAQLEAGRDYLAAVEQLGLRPSALFWAWDRTVESFVLVLVSRAFDVAGPLALSRTLFDAYNKAGTPKTVDPFILRLHSPKQQIVREISRFFPFKAQSAKVVRPDGMPVPDIKDARFVSLKVDAADLEVHSAWVLRFDPADEKTTNVETGRRWRRFVSNVQQLAA